MLDKRAAQGTLKTHKTFLLAREYVDSRRSCVEHCDYIDTKLLRIRVWGDSIWRTETSFVIAMNKVINCLQGYHTF